MDVARVILYNCSDVIHDVPLKNPEEKLELAEAQELVPRGTFNIIGPVPGAQHAPDVQTLEKILYPSTG